MESKYRCEQALTPRLSLHTFLFDHCPEEPHRRRRELPACFSMALLNGSRALNSEVDRVSTSTS